MAYHGVAECFGRKDRWFTGVVVTNGAGSPRAGIYGDYTDEEMQQVRLLEQRKAAYRRRVRLPDPARLSPAPRSKDPAGDARWWKTCTRILLAARPGGGLPAQPGRQARHPRGRGAARHRRAARRAADVQAREGLRLRSVARPGLAATTRTSRLLPVSARSNIAAALVGVFDSQVSGGKRYDLATAGRRLAHATYYASHGTDQESALNFAMDLTPLVEDPDLPVADYVLGFVDRFRADVEKRIAAAGGGTCSVRTPPAMP